MPDTPRYQRDLFETLITPKNIPSSSEAPMLELLKALLTEALGADVVGARNASKEADDDEDHA
jgi:hypothetical protein